MSTEPPLRFSPQHREAWQAARDWQKELDRVIKSQPQFICPNCQETMVFSPKTQVFYHTKRNSKCRNSLAILKGADDKRT